MPSKLEANRPVTAPTSAAERITIVTAPRRSRLADAAAGLFFALTVTLSIGVLAAGASSSADERPAHFRTSLTQN